MIFFLAAFRNSARRPLRTLVTVMGVAIAIGALFSLWAFQDGYRRGVQRELNQLGAHILVAPKGCPYDAASIALHGASWPCYLKENYLHEVSAVRGVHIVAPVFMSAIYGDLGRATVFVGIDRKMLTLKRGWKINGTFPEKDGEILIGSAVASRWRWAAGESVVLPGLKNSRGIVRGILEPTQSADDDFIFLRLVEAQQLFQHPNELTHMLVRLKDPENLDGVVADLRGCDAGMLMNVIPLTHVFRTIQRLVGSARVLLACTAAIALLAAAAGVSAAFLIAVAERTREIGVMRAIGASRIDIFFLFLIEAVQLSLAGAVLGIAASLLSSRLLENWLRHHLPFTPHGSLVHASWTMAACCLLVAVILGSVAGFLPAWRAARLSPIFAIRARGGWL